MSEAYGIAIGCLATSCSFANAANVESHVTSAKRVIDLASMLGTPVIRVFGGVIPKDTSRADSFKSIVSALSRLSGYALERNVTVCMETHDSWCSPDDVADVMLAVDHPSIAVNWDIMHPVMSASYTIKQSFDRLKPWIKHVHVHDGATENNNRVLKPIGEGVVDHKTAITLLKEAGYDGYISGEWIGWEPYDIHLPRELGTLKSYLKHAGGI